MEHIDSKTSAFEPSFLLYRHVAAAAAAAAAAPAAGIAWHPEDIYSVGQRVSL